MDGNNIYLGYLNMNCLVLNSASPDASKMDFPNVWTFFCGCPLPYHLSPFPFPSSAVKGDQLA